MAREMKECPACYPKGSGRCYNCSGKGKTGIFGDKCNHCNGTGHCRRCNGKGVVPKD